MPRREKPCVSEGLIEKDFDANADDCRYMRKKPVT